MFGLQLERLHETIDKKRGDDAVLCKYTWIAKALTQRHLGSSPIELMSNVFMLNISCITSLYEAEYFLHDNVSRPIIQFEFRGLRCWQKLLDDDEHSLKNIMKDDSYVCADRWAPGI